MDIYELTRDAQEAGMFDGDREEINEKVSEGSFCVVSHAPVYCRMTDAILGSAPHLVGSFDSMEEAAAEADRIAIKWGDPELSFDIEPTARPVVAPPVETDIPF